MNQALVLGFAIFAWMALVAILVGAPDVYDSELRPLGLAGLRDEADALGGRLPDRRRSSFSPSLAHGGRRQHTIDDSRRFDPEWRSSRVRSVPEVRHVRKARRARGAEK
jgi:hypothetical protein